MSVAPAIVLAALVASAEAPPRHGPMTVAAPPAAPTELARGLGTTCSTRKGTCQLNTPMPRSSGCECRFDGEAVSGRVTN